MTPQWQQLVAPDWVPVISALSPHLTQAGAFLRSELKENRPYLPPNDAILRAFSHSFAAVKVLVVGQDPYPTPGHAMGLAFSVPQGIPMPRSLKNIASELRADTGEELRHGDLTHWSDQGVLLLNRALTVRVGAPGSHRNQGWEEFTAGIITALVARQKPLVSILWGRDAAALAPQLSDFPVVSSAHPSPLSASRGFFGSRPFSKTNSFLQAQGITPIQWGHSDGA